MKIALKFLCVLCLVFCTTYASAQSRYVKGDVLINAGIGLGYYYTSGGVPIVLSGEYAVNDVISVGPYVGFTSRSEKFVIPPYSYKYSWTFVDVGIRGSYHFNELLEISDEAFDVYGGIFLGYLVSNFSYKTDAPNMGGAWNSRNSYPGAFRAGLHIGGRYYFTPTIAAYAEVGYGIAPLSLGATFKL